MRITVIGCGYLGVTHAVCMAELDHDVLGIDHDRQRVADLSSGRAPFFEPGVDEMLARHVSSGRLRFTDDCSEAGDREIHFLAVGTPASRDGRGYDLSQLFTAVRLLAPRLSTNSVVVGQSTVPVGTAARLDAELRAEAQPGVSVALVWHPEFLRESHAVADSLRPARLVFGFGPGERKAEDVIRRCFVRAIDSGTPTIFTDWATAELTKSAANAFLATKISFINAIAEVCDAVDADVRQLADALGRDPRIGHQGMRPGIGFGGGCLPKDVRGFAIRVGELGLDEVGAMLLDVQTINDRCRGRMLELVVAQCGGSVAGRRIAVWGAAFKPNTDDIRESPALAVADALHRSGALVTVFDPAAMDNARRAFPDLEYADEPATAVHGTDLLLHLTEWSLFAQFDPVELRPGVGGSVVIDGCGTLDPDRWSAAGWTYRALGSPGRVGAMAAEGAPANGARDVRRAPR